MTWFIIVNPASGGGAAERCWPQVEQVLQSLGIAYSVHFTERRGHAMRLVDDAVLKGHRYLLGIGGDGTNHEIVNGILQQTTVPSSEIYYALLPVGTGNDWAHMYRIPGDPQRRLERLLEPKTVLQDAGWVRYQRDGQPQERFFVNVAGMAYDGYIGQQLENSPVTNRLQYLLAVSKYLFKYHLSKARITFDGQTAEDFFYTINIGLCKYSGGGMQFVPQAVPNDGLFALTFARSLPKWEVLLQTPRFYNGTLLQHPRIEGYQAKNIRVEHTDGIPTLLEADGEFLGETPVEFRILENALRIVL